jgi:CheY-like chemotaxis protein
MCKKLLLVEDNPDHAILTRIALERTGYDHDLVMVQDGLELLDYLFRQGPYSHLTRADMPDLVFLDLQLPNMDGLEVLRLLKGDERTRTIPIIMLSASSEASDIRASYDLGANSYIRKRIKAEEFQEMLRAILAYWFDFVILPPRVCLEKETVNH